MSSNAPSRISNTEKYSYLVQILSWLVSPLSARKTIAAWLFTLLCFTFLHYCFPYPFALFSLPILVRTLKLKKGLFFEFIAPTIRKDEFSIL